jgi:acyl-CoA oxidase
MPELAKTYGITFLVNDCKRVYAAYLAKPTKELNRQVHLFACIVKAFGSWYNTETLQVCREACGGQGFLLRNLIAALRTESEIFTTFDGANRPLCLSAARLILEKFAAKAGAWDVIVSEFHNWCGYFEGNSSIAEAGTLHRLFELREHALTYQCAQLLRKDRSFDAFNASAPLLVKLAQAHTEKRVLEAFLSRVKILEKKKSAAAPVLRDLMVLYGLHCATADAYFVTEGLVSASAFRKAQVEKQEYCGKVTKYSLSLVKAFKTPSWVLEPTIANDWVAINARDNDVM